jgi:DNA-directed RNA polymerase specialized sigma24 family protein
MYNVAYRIVDEHYAEDVMQEGFFKSIYQN